MLMKKLLVFAFCFVYVSVAQAQLRVVNYNVHFCSADMEAMKIVLDATSLDNTHGEAIPVSVFMFQEVKIKRKKRRHR